MNWLLIIVLAIFVIFAVRGWRRGLLRMLFSLVSVIVLIALVSFATPHITAFLREHTAIHETVQERCADNIRKEFEKKGDEIVSSASSKEMSLPEQVTSYLVGQGEAAIEASGFYESMGSKAADFILSGISFFAALIFALLAVLIISRALRIVNHIPILKGINRALGIFAGIFAGFILVCLLFFFLALISATPLGQTCMDFINGNPFLEYFYYRNPLLEIFTGLLSGKPRI